jgi:hypothetical protein
MRADALDIDADGLPLLRREIQQGLASGEPVRWSPEAIKAEGRALLQVSPLQSLCRLSGPGRRRGDLASAEHRRSESTSGSPMASKPIKWFVDLEVAMKTTLDLPLYRPDPQLKRLPTDVAKALRLEQDTLMQKDRKFMR